MNVSRINREVDGGRPLLGKEVRSQREAARGWRAAGQEGDSPGWRFPRRPFLRKSSQKRLIRTPNFMEEMR